MPAIKLRTAFAPLAAAFTVALASFTMATAFGPVSAAHAEDNGDGDISKEEACAYLEDAYNRASEYASQARAAGKTSEYEYWTNLVGEIYLDAEFDWECDWAVKAIRPGHGDILAPTLPGYAIFSDGSAGPVGPTTPATKNERNFRRWLRSKHHAAGCRNQRTVARGADAEQAGLIRVAAHFTHCGWARELPLTVATVTDTPPQTDGTTEPSGGTVQPQPVDGNVAPPPTGAETPPASDGSGSGPLL